MEKNLANTIVNDWNERTKGYPNEIKFEAEAVATYKDEWMVFLYPVAENRGTGFYDIQGLAEVEQKYNVRALVTSGADDTHRIVIYARFH